MAGLLIAPPVHYTKTPIVGKMSPVTTSRYAEDKLKRDQLGFGYHRMPNRGRVQWVIGHHSPCAVYFGRTMAICFGEIRLSDKWANGLLGFQNTGLSAGSNDTNNKFGA